MPTTRLPVLLTLLSVLLACGGRGAASIDPAPPRDASFTQHSTTETGFESASGRALGISEWWDVGHYQRMQVLTGSDGGRRINMFVDQQSGCVLLEILVM